MASVFTDGSIEEVLAAIPGLTIPAASLQLQSQKVVIVGGSVGGLAAAACLRTAGFSNIIVLDKSVVPGAGAGIGLDDVSVGILKSLGLEFGIGQPVGTGDPVVSGANVTLQRLRWVEERVVPSATVLDRQAFPYSAVRYSELVQGLEKVVQQGSIVLRGKKCIQLEEHVVDGVASAQVSVEDASSGEVTTIQADLVVVADGPRSQFRAQLSQPENRDDLVFAGYVAWRGTVPEVALPLEVQAALRVEYADFSNCLYFIWGPPGKSAVLYDIGNGLVNWLVYECCDQPKSPPGRTTTTATPEDVANLRRSARSEWGKTLGAVIEHTPEPFQNDIYDLEVPLATFSTGNICLLGDAAHPITPHCAKGSNLALHDAFVLASVAQGAGSLPEMLTSYSQKRVADCGNAILLSRYLGRLRNGMPLKAAGAVRIVAAGDFVPRPEAAKAFLMSVKDLPVPTSTLPSDELFAPTWKFVGDCAPMSKLGFWLRRGRAELGLTQKPSLEIVQVNHVSLETEQVDALAFFYQHVLGLKTLPRPNFGFGGVWLQLPGGQALHIIQKDPAKPCSADVTGGRPPVPERFIRRSHHTAFTVLDIEAAKQTLDAHGIPYAINQVPDTPIEQVFLYDPDGNGVEIGNFFAQDA